MKKILKKIISKIDFPKRIALTSISIVVIVAVLSFGLLVLNPSISTMSDITNAASKGLGKTVGLAIGSAKAIAKAKEKANDIVDDETVNPEITVSIEEDVKSIGKLEVLSAEIVIHHVYTSGGGLSEDEKPKDYNNTNYASLSLLKADGVFSVDLLSSTVTVSGKNIEIKLPSPVLSLEFGDNNREKLFEYSKKGIDTNKADETYNGYLKSADTAIQEARDNIASYGTLLNDAKKSAEKTITRLFVSMRGDEYNIKFKWEGNGEIKNAR